MNRGDTEASPTLLALCLLVAVVIMMFVRVHREKNGSLACGVLYETSEANTAGV